MTTPTEALRLLHIVNFAYIIIIKNSHQVNKLLCRLIHIKAKLFIAIVILIVIFLILNYLTYNIENE